MKLKKSAKIRKNEKTQHLIRCIKFKKQFKINFENFCQFLAHFEQKVAKKRVFCDFLKKYEFWSKFDIFNVFLVKFPFWKCILFLCTFMNALRSYVTNVMCSPPLRCARLERCAFELNIDPVNAGVHDETRYDVTLFLEMGDIYSGEKCSHLGCNQFSAFNSIPQKMTSNIVTYT